MWSLNTLSTSQEPESDVPVKHQFGNCILPSSASLLRKCILHFLFRTMALLCSINQLLHSTQLHLSDTEGPLHLSLIYYTEMLRINICKALQRSRIPGCYRRVNYRMLFKNLTSLFASIGQLPESKLNSATHHQ